MGIKTVSIYSDLDRKSQHVLCADEAYHLPGKSASETYLDKSKIIQIAEQASCDAIHPGYGFLSENPEFAKAVDSAGLIFIGPTAEAIRTMGNKVMAKEAVIPFDVPLVPGTDHTIKDIETGIEIAQEIGFPILIKAAAGGGGKGMRIVQHLERFNEAFTRAVSEATSSFGDGSVFIEKYIEDPKHIEVQILADRHGQYLHLFERECSIQRRHQKVIEEAPSPSVNPELREQLGQTAINVAKACGYQNAGTVEFIMDQSHNFYFLEMNTRLQVEHPVTEMITGIDLVEQQIRIAEGHKLDFNQSDISIKGHAIELRVYAENSKNNFLPSPGTITRYVQPTGDHLRLDDGVVEQSEISVYYDPMISKLIAHGDNRMKAIEYLKQGIHDYDIQGVETTLDFGLFVLTHPSFLDGSFNTHFVDAYYYPSLAKRDRQEEEIAALLGADLYT